MLHQRRILKRGDPYLLVVVGLLLTIGMVMVYSCTQASMVAEGRSPTSKLMMQLAWLVIALVVMVIMAMVDYEKIGSLAVPLMGVVVFFLLVVLVVGSVQGEVRGTKRWIGIGPLHIQPSEPAKVAVIIILAVYLANRDDEVDTLSLVSRSLFYALIPTSLILLQPDLGTPVVIMFIWLVLLTVAGARIAHLTAFVLVGLLLFGAAWNMGVIPEHQKSRLMAFMYPEADPTGAGWQLKQSLIAIGSGGLSGQGLFRGKQTQLGFIPDQETDFIFTAIGEEGGFLGCLLTLSLFMALLLRTLHIASQAKDQLGMLMAVGISALFFIHIVVNVGMTLGLLPVKGMPLPFVSYGGSNLVTNMACVGLLENIYMRRHKIAF